MSLALGTAVRDITPPPGLPMGGYAARTEPAEATLDPLRCKAAVLRDGERTVVVALLDLIYVRNPWAAAVRSHIADNLGTAAEAVMIAATHTHAGPAVFRSSMVETEKLSSYELRLAETITDAVDEAAKAARAVTLAYGEAAVDAVAANRQEPGREIDRTVRVLVARGLDSRPAAFLAAFGCHPTVLSAANRSYSRDLFGAAVDLVESEAAAPALLFNGAAGDVSTRFTREAQTHAEVGRLGGLLGAAVLEAIRRAAPIAGGPLTARAEEIAVEPRPLPSASEAEAQLAAAAARLEEARGKVAPAELRRLTAHVEGAAAQLYFSRQGGVEALLGAAPENATVQALRLGGCDLLGVPGEMFSSVGRQICGRRRQPTLLAGYANDYIGYLVPPGSAEGYESLIAFVTETSAARVAAALTADLEARA